VKIDIAVERVKESEEALATGLESVGEHHSDDHDVFHITRTLAKRSRARIDRLGGKEATAVGKKLSDSGDLLGDLRGLYMLASEASIDWTILGQAAQAAKDAELLGLVDECHADELRTLKWATTRVKEAAPQALTSWKSG
jgi:hypothetical protein